MQFDVLFCPSQHSWQPIECRLVGNAVVESNSLLAFFALPINSKLKPLKRIFFSKR